MTINEAIARGYNFFMVATLGIISGTLILEPFQEDEWLYKIDDLLTMAIGVVAIGWYFLGKNRLMRSWLPLALSIAALLTKIAALLIERGDPQDVGDDIGYVFLLAIFVVVGVVAFIRTRPGATGLPEPTAEA